MKKGVFILLISLGFLVGCQKPMEVKVQDSETNAHEAQELIQFIRHKKSGMCFAYLWQGGGYQGGPALAHVDCKDVPPELFVSQ